MQGVGEGPLPEGDWWGFVTRAVCDFGAAMNDAWHWTPQEWWQCWSFKYGERHKILTGEKVSQDEAAAMAADLEEAIRKERRE
jgi:hypothetical protein